MTKKKFTFEDENEEIQKNHSLQSQIDIYDRYQEASQQIHTNTPIQHNQKEIKAQTPLHKPQHFSQKNKKTVPPLEEQSSKPMTIYKTKPKTKIKKKIKRKTKHKTKTKKRKRSWFSTLCLFLLSVFIIIGICAGGYVVYHGYREQQAQIDRLEKQLENQSNEEESDQQLPPSQSTIPEENPESPPVSQEEIQENPPTQP